MKRFNLKEKAEYVGTLRAVNVALMELLARWIPTTPEMEAKVLFGRHVWDVAQHADLLGKRVFELRKPLHYSAPIAEPYRAWIDRVSQLTGTADRMAAMYECVIPALERRCRDYIECTDALQDEPTVRILERIVQDHARMRREYPEFRGQIAGLGQPASDLIGDLNAMESGSIFVCPETATVGAAAGA